MPTHIISKNTTGSYAGDSSGITDTFGNVYSPSSPMYSDGTEFDRIVAKSGELAGYLSFDLSALPSDITIDSIELGLYMYDASGFSGSINIQPLLRAFVEDEATWNVWSTGNNWTVQGGRGVDTDRATDDADTTRRAAKPGSSGNWATIGTSAMLADVVAAYEAESDRVVRWRYDDTADYAFYRSSRGTDGQRPYLLVEYTAGGGPDYTVEADSGTYTYSGGDATLAASRRLDAQGGTFSYSGGDADLSVSRRLAAQGGSYAYTGGDAGLIASRVLSADGGAYSYAGGTAGLLVSRLLDAQGGTYSYAGGDASFTVAGVFQLAAEGGTFAYTGGDATLTVSRRLSAEGATYTYSGGDAGLYARRALSAQGGTYTYAGGDADLVYNPGVFTLVAEGGTYTYTGGDAALIYSGAVRIRPWPGDLVMRPAYSWGDDLTLQRQYPPIPLNLS